MARTGLYKSEVKKARDALIAQGKHPSVDAVRVALGNTGSKTTIHKYLRELDAEDGGAAGRKASISEALQDLVERLAAQLQEESNVRIDAAHAELAEQERRHLQDLAAAHHDAEQLGGQMQRVETLLQQEQDAHSRVRETLQQETIARHTAEQQVADIKERLAENDAHRRSLEEKHQHAREALEHYRQAVKDQRDQDQRRHEQQFQQLQAELRQAQQTIVVKQEEITRLNQEGARLVAELAHTRQDFQQAQELNRRQTQKLEALQPIEQHNGVLTAQLADKDAYAHALQEQLAVALAQAGSLSTQVHELELAVAQSQVRYETQQGIVQELRSYLAPTAKTT
jgi:DNA repair exonuclease SbcCD ATPase subunit